ncbi:NAD synthetase [Pseudomonas sp. 250J]|uniref:NAD synthetase n=1 Tax=Pseudomonas peradeniyensis TaxID=2745488 RepID=A0ABT2V4F1_9PSED|nr:MULTISPECIES: NAD synthetase [unclassified Pseudomonas]KNX80518.1 NAD synthetase [Pseudomonas sp. 250J]MCU7236613.1 NAD synthetase [Pseudomonas peradeniyensis]MCU7278405.1 NAD synthetase [Pseudomonas peradeniyensis]QZA54738.1 NAD synthetase [Pseudomonas sp. 2hn]
MTDLLVNSLANNSQFLARQRIQGRINLPQMFAAIDADPRIVGAGVVYIDADYNVVTLREFQPICSIRPKRVILREIKKYQTPDQYTQQLQHNPRESRVVKEAVNTTLSCAGAVIGWFVVFSGTIAAPFSGGTSLVLTYIGGAAATASSIQCGIGVMRTVREVTNPAANDALDENEWYQAASKVLDGVSLLGVGASGLSTLKYLQVHKAATGRSWLELSRSLSRQQRKALTDELLSIRHPSLTAKQIKLRQAAGTMTKRYTPTEISHATKTLMRDSLGATFGLAGSATVQSIAVGLYEEIE